VEARLKLRDVCPQPGVCSNNPHESAYTPTLQLILTAASKSATKSQPYRPLPRSSRQTLASPATSPASSRSIDFHACMSLSVRVALACIRYRMILGHGLVSEKILHMLAVAIAIVCSTGDCRARRLICYSLSLLTRYTFLDDVDYLVDDSTMDDIRLSPELDGTKEMPARCCESFYEFRVCYRKEYMKLRT
jgi:hypothetical protein